MMIRHLSLLGPAKEADIWSADDIVQIRFRAEPGYALSRWLGHCRQWLLQNFQLTDVVPGAASITLIGVKHGQVDALLSALQVLPEQTNTTSTTHVIEVGYHPQWMDTAQVCKQLNIEFEPLVDLHSNSDYYLSFMGFLPGFVYLGGGSPLLDIPRKEKPMARVPAGSVAIAAGYTGIYPQQSPGGWHIIGHTQNRIFDPDQWATLPWQVGDRVSILPYIMSDLPNIP